MLKNDLEKFSLKERLSREREMIIKSKAFLFWKLMMFYKCTESASS